MSRLGWAALGAAALAGAFILAGADAWQIWVFLFLPDVGLLAGMSSGLEKGQLHPRAVPLYNALHRPVGPTVWRWRRSSSASTGSRARSPGWPTSRSTARSATGCATSRGSSGPAVRDRRAAVPAERLRVELHARRRLPALVLGAVDQRAARARRRRASKPVREQLLARAVLLDVLLEHAVELGVRRQRVLVELLRPQLGARAPAR